MNNPQQNRPHSSNSRSVFVGNIPYEATEEQLQDIFSQVGPVVSFRLVFDRDTGKPKGYGFVEYRDSQTALSAMRNLNGYEINARCVHPCAVSLLRANAVERCECTLLKWKANPIKPFLPPVSHFFLSFPNFSSLVR
jgi:hypothetical protein